MIKVYDTVEEVANDFGVCPKKYQVYMSFTWWESTEGRVITTMTGILPDVIYLLKDQFYWKTDGKYYVCHDTKMIRRRDLHEQIYNLHVKENLTFEQAILVLML